MLKKRPCKIYKIKIKNFKKYNHSIKKSHKSTLISNNFCTDNKLNLLPLSHRWMFLGILLMCGSDAIDTVECNDGQLRDLLESSSSVPIALSSLQSLQLLTYEEIELSFSPFRKERKRKERNIVVVDSSSKEEELPKNTTTNEHWFLKFIVQDLNSLDTGLSILGPRVDRAFGSELGFREWLAGVTATKKFKEISADEQVRYFKKSLTDEMKLRGIL